jgi:hypothetical protein
VIGFQVVGGRDQDRTDRPLLAKPDNRLQPVRRNSTFGIIFQVAVLLLIQTCTRSVCESQNRATLRVSAGAISTAVRSCGTAIPRCALLVILRFAKDSLRSPTG